MNTLALLGIEAPSEILLILLVVLLLFGGKKIPELARSLGKSIGEFKRGQNEGQQAVKESEKAKLSAPQAGRESTPAAKTESETKKGAEE